ncbi:MAG: ankyrin repeat domain-containing protein [Wolbachia endosymbiont of Menacanthus eurysternus]|nr:ankyrin repeat domain-containing protein [Wolbachia endosymbiont of Menacanthus eurysternus]
MLNGTRGYDVYETLRRYCENKNERTDYERLIGEHAEINAKDSQGRTALHYAAYFNNTDMVELLLDAGAKTNIKDNNGKKPLSFAKNKEIIDLLKGLPARCGSVK